ncbi:STAS domain-containing protein [Streptomyces ficellus]|uniref:Anti-sigma factor antagonist n=1 Tax=Streptomyces ficellus TaxID=1977088 RepID=A0A6I6FM09_9ACTN|nr:STAS domain-containing protein [Streptomyces ficellus]QGV77276.1 anti-sigma factor antagonist [Streptomyces ficellus]
MTDTHGAQRPGRLSIDRSSVNGVRVVALRGEIDHDVKDVLSTALLPRDGQDGARLVVDLSGVTFMDSSGINVFIAAHRAQAGPPGRLRFAGVREPVLRIIEIVGLDSLIPCHPTVEEAVLA